MISKLIFILLILAVAGGVYYWKFADKKSVDSFEECVKASGVILETFPEQCVVPGVPKTFTNPTKNL